MIVGIPKGKKDDECRAYQIPASVQVLTEASHSVLVEQGAGEPGGFGDGDYLKAGDGVSSNSEAVLKVLPRILAIWLYFLLKIRRVMWRVRVFIQMAG